MSCGVQMTPEKRTRKHAPGGVPSVVPDCCWDCWTTMSTYQRILVVIAIRDRLVGGVLAEMAAALDRLDQSKDGDSDNDWRG